MPTIQPIDQFFTKPYIASLCWRSLCPVLRKLTGKNTDELFFIEPSAGDGAFYRFLPQGDMHRVGVDIAPRCEEFIRRDFLTWDYRPFHYRRPDIVVVGNPPFGKRGALAVKFFQKAAEIADTIAFIVPVIFRKFFVHKQLPPNFRWVYATDLPRLAFRTDKKDEYEVNTEFQVWTRLSSTHKDSRLFTPPPPKTRRL